MVIEGDRVVTRYVSRGTHQVPFLGQSLLRLALGQQGNAHNAPSADVPLQVKAQTLLPEEVEFFDDHGMVCTMFLGVQIAMVGCACCGCFSLA
jgi:hypothetical protein